MLGGLGAAYGKETQQNVHKQFPLDGGPMGDFFFYFSQFSSFPLVNP